MTGEGPRPSYNASQDFLGSWTNEKVRLRWRALLARPGVFEVQITLACQPGSEGSRYAISAAGQELVAEVARTKGWEDFRTFTLGSVNLTAVTPGEVEITLKPLAKPGAAVMNLRSMVLLPKP